MPQPGHRRPLSAPLAALAAAALCSCAAARLDTIQVGPWFPARPPSEVAVLGSRAETTVPWGAIGIIHGPRVPAGSGEIEKHKRQAREEAARMGADALILVVEAASDDGQLEVRSDPEVFISGLAVKYVPDAKPPENKP